MNVIFREIDPFDLWIWVELVDPPTTIEQQYLEEVFNSWFFLGKLGGFNAENLQVQETGLDLSHLEYDTAQADSSLMAVMHNMGEFEYNGNWARCWFDLGTSDALALDVLINALTQFSEDYVPIANLVIGGDHPEWPIATSEQREVIQQSAWN
ncbi:DUF3531 family protein [Thermosynechococcaceae cyanobacterium Okahandja]